MKFKPLSKKYQFDDTLVMDFPGYMEKSLSDWLFEVLCRAGRVKLRGSTLNERYYLTDDFHEALQINLREKYPMLWSDFDRFVFSDIDRTLTVFQWCLNHYARKSEGKNLEWALSIGGSGWAVLLAKKDASDYDDGVCDLVERVPSATKQLAEAAIGSNDELLKAWSSCYGHNPNYNETVQACQNVLEQLLRDTYLSKDAKAQLGKLIADIRAGKTLSFKGSKVVSQPNVLLDLIDNVPMYRGVHKAGTGKDAKRAEAECILLSTIYIWSLHQGK